MLLPGKALFVAKLAGKCVWGAVHLFLFPFHLHKLGVCSHFSWWPNYIKCPVEWVHSLVSWLWTHIFYVCLKRSQEGEKGREGRPSVSANMACGNRKCGKTFPFLLKWPWLSTPVFLSFTVFHSNIAVFFYPCVLGKINPFSGLFTVTHGLVGSELGCKVRRTLNSGLEKTFLFWVMVLSFIKWKSWDCQVDLPHCLA